MRKRAITGIAGSLMMAGLAFAPSASAYDGQTLKSDAIGSDATCTMDSTGSGMKVYCKLRDTKSDGNSVRIEWSGPGKDGKDNLRSGEGTHANYTYTFAREGAFTFKAVTDRGWLPDSVGATRTLHP
ncbi:hypothetical protein GCM10023347_09570 [Streptomyces chumphonensis]|uniref:Uncharacterized protein n=1 Tax=Streptomyces chumphonensis TaxID=1214925 RepID=A0A927IEL0_9ACTN|nr:hypothetical protein [Streptomyces chumphonensis]MBD3934035.1 hypothetical protein [Streptomyces chumphonensis]